MNTIQLECFVTVAEYLNFSKASRTLKLTQPAVTHQIQTLEKELDVKLFRPHSGRRSFPVRRQTDSQNRIFRQGTSQQSRAFSSF